MRIGTRGSALALAQAHSVAERLGGPAEIVTVTTAGDRNRAAGDKSRWTGALEQALLAGEIDLAVHSAKDVPGALAPGTALLAAPPRADAADVLVGSPGGLDGLAEGARVGTSALRRRAQLLAVRADLDVVELRGNVDTRLRKLAAGEVDALVLARAGLARLELLADGGAAVRLPDGGEVPAAALDGHVFVPAPGQGTLAVQGRAEDPRAHAAAATLVDPAAWAALQAERAAVVALGRELPHARSASTPPAAACAASRACRTAARGCSTSWRTRTAIPPRTGETLAARLLAAGAADLLARAEAEAMT